jgi:murein DD-endopeptidase MepM/ murein hydrolase activator NlpD
MRVLLKLAHLAALLLSGEVAFAASAGGIAWPKALEIFQGDLVETSVTGSALAAVEGTFGKEKIFFYATGPSTFRAVLGADVDAKPAASALRLSAKTHAGGEIRFDVPIKIKAKGFKQESFNVPPGFDQMTPENLAEIRREQSAFARAFAAPETGRFWEAPFIRPVPHEESASSFGRRRIINGTPRAPHSGLDLSSPAGTEVVATNHGKVVLAGNFFFAGGSVVVDHGGSLFTMYFHLSDIRVGEGDFVRRGDVVALSGATGRVTGAHLHWGARLANARIDPLELIRKVSTNWQPASQMTPPAIETEK